MTTDPAARPLYRPVPAMLDLPAMEREILDFWAENDTFAASLERTAGGRPRPSSRSARRRSSVACSASSR